MKQYSFEKTIERKFDSDPDLALLLTREKIEDLKVAAKMKKRKEIVETFCTHKIFRLGDYFCTYIEDEGAPEGRKRIKSKTKEGLEEKILDLYERKNNVVVKPMTFGETYYAWRKVHDMTMCANSIRMYETDCIRFFEGSEIMRVLIKSLTRSDVEAFIAQKVFTLKLCQSACKKLYEYTKDTFEYAVEKELIDRNPMYGIKCSAFYRKCTNSKRSRTNQVFTDDEIEKINEQIWKDHNEHPEYIPSYALEFAMLTGARAGEISAVKWKDVADSYIFISRSEKYDRKKKIFFIDDTKNRIDRTIPMTEALRDLLDRIKTVEKKYGFLSEYVFSNEGGRINAPTISSCIRNKCKQVGVDPRGIHNIRKTVNSKLKKFGASTMEASVLLGHSEETNSKYYTYDVTSMEEKRKLMEIASIVSKRKNGTD